MRYVCSDSKAANLLNTMGATPEEEEEEKKPEFQKIQSNSIHILAPHQSAPKVFISENFYFLLPPSSSSSLFLSFFLFCFIFLMINV